MELHFERERRKTEGALGRSEVHFQVNFIAFVWLINGVTNNNYLERALCESLRINVWQYTTFSLRFSFVVASFLFNLILRQE